MAIVTEPVWDLAPSPGDRGLATQDPEELARRTLRAWDLIAELAETTDLAATTYTGRTAKDLLTGLGRWPDSRWVAEALLEAETGTEAGTSAGGRTDQDADEDRLRDVHRSATRAQLITSLRRAGKEARAFFGSKDDETYGLRAVASPLGPIPFRTFLHATCYRLAVAALDLPSSPDTDAAVQEIVELGLVALVDAVGALAAREGLVVHVTGDTEVGSWTFSAADEAWMLTESDVRPPGPAVICTARTLLEVSSGRAEDVGGMYRRGELRLEDVPGMLRLVPLLDHVPGIPGAAGLKLAARSFELASRTLGLAGSAFGRLRRPFG
jgi:hypothetical protein